MSRDDGLRLRDVFISAVNRCAPPDNKPTPQERDTCLPYVERELGALGDLRVIVALGSFAWDGGLRALGALGHALRPKPRFGHLAEAAVGLFTLVGCFHPSQQNTFGKARNIGSSFGEVADEQDAPGRALGIDAELGVEQPARHRELVVGPEPAVDVDRRELCGRAGLGEQPQDGVDRGLRQRRDVLADVDREIGDTVGLIGASAAPGTAARIVWASASRRLRLSARSASPAKKRRCMVFAP